MVGQPVRLYKWPTSQICLECDHGALVQIGDLFEELQDPASVICMENCGDNDGISCSTYDSINNKKERRNEL